MSASNNPVKNLAEHPPLRETRLTGVKLFSRGKVRDVYEVSGDRLLVVATDRLSAFDVVMAEGIPDKGQVLTQLSCFWFNYFRGVVPHHFLTARMADFPPELRPFADQLAGRSMLVEKARPFPIECVVRGYLAGSGWKDYQATGAVCGVKLPPGLRESSKLEQPIFTPSTKAQEGHDENIDWEETVRRIGLTAAERLRDYSLTLYMKARDYAEGRGILLADTKFEFGLLGESVILIDEVLTPDSSRFWPKQGYEPGKPQPSFDKQFVRDYLESIRWNKQPPPPPLPPEVLEKTSEKYREAFRLLTGRNLN
jgi:phosphoribosylaminoimidazole-succinocarboxamide synthase